MAIISFGDDTQRHQAGSGLTGRKRALLGRDGFTLIEMLVALAITSILVAVVALAFTGQSRSYNSQQEIISLQQNMRSALQFLAKEVRLAGYDPTGSANAGIITATGSELRFTRDIGDGAGGTSDGDTDDPEEDIRYALSADGALGRETGGTGGLQPVATNIVQLAFEYYMDNETWTQTPGDPNDIRAVKIMILGRSARETSRTVDTSTFRPPMESGTPPLWTPANPGHHHWRMMSLIVQCRNLSI